jgi:hypothetical protein
MRPLGSTLEPAVESLHAAALALWFAALVGAGLAAAVAFPEMKRLDPRLPEFGAYAGEHWMIAGGHVGRRVFALADRVQLIASAVGVLTLAAVTRLRVASRPWMAVRWIGVGVAAGLAVYNGLMLAPRMDTNLVAYWEAARVGDEPRAARFKTAFSAEHPQASRVLSISAGGVLLGLVAAAASRGPVGRARSASKGL